MQNKKEIHADRIVIKIGTSTLIHNNSQPNMHVIERLAYVLSS